MKETCVPLSDQWPVIAFENGEHFWRWYDRSGSNRAILVLNNAMIHVRIMVSHPLGRSLLYYSLHHCNLRGSILIKLPVFPAYCKRVYHRLAHQIIIYNYVRLTIIYSFHGMLDDSYIYTYLYI